MGLALSTGKNCGGVLDQSIPGHLPTECHMLAWGVEGAGRPGSVAPTSERCFTKKILMGSGSWSAEEPSGHYAGGPWAAWGQAPTLEGSDVRALVSLHFTKLPDSQGQGVNWRVLGLLLCHLPLLPVPPASAGSPDPSLWVICGSSWDWWALHSSSMILIYKNKCFCTSCLQIKLPKVCSGHVTAQALLEQAAIPNSVPV